MVVHVRFEYLYIFLPSSAKQQREMTKSCVLLGACTAMVSTFQCSFVGLRFCRYFLCKALLDHWELALYKYCILYYYYIQPGQVFMQIDVLNRPTQLRHSRVKYFYFAFEFRSFPNVAQ